MLNSNKCIFCAPFGMLVGHIISKKGLLVDLAKIELILSLSPPTNVNMLRETLGHTGYYHKFIRGYAAITSPMKKLLKKYVAFVWSPECQGIFDALKAKIASTHILVFPDWTKEFHVHVDSSSVVLGVVLLQLEEGDLNHPITFAS